MPPNILITAGEASADKHAASLIRALRALYPQAHIYGMGGAEMRKAGFEAYYDMHELSVMGFSDVAPRIAHIIKVYRNLRRIMLSRRTDIFIPVDLPDFNMPLARFAYTHGIKALYYIAPQAWAWRAQRAKKLGITTNGMAVIFPFEEDFFTRAGAHARYVGHPILEDGFPLHNVAWPPKRVALMPGSRMGDIEHMLPVMLGAKRIIAERYPELSWFLPVAPGIDRAGLEAKIDSDITLCASLPEVDFAMVKSGTSSFELALAGVPEVICYRTSPLNYRLAQTFVQVEHIGMPNIIAGSRIAPELIQDDCTETSLANSVLRYMEHETLYWNMRSSFLDMRTSLGEKKASQEVAAWVKNLL